MRRSLFTVVILVTALSILLAACAPAAPAVPTTAPAEPAVVEPTAAPIEPTAVVEPTAAMPEPAPASSEGIELPAVDFSMLEGTVYSAGSSTVYPLSEAIATAFTSDGFKGEVKIDSIGSGAGFERFCKSGETDIANASRAIKDAEIENCKAINRTPIEFRVGTDAIAVVVSKENDFLTGVTMEELGKIFTSDAEKWSDVNSDWPAEPIQRFTPGTDSGTFDFFVETAIQKPRKIEKLDEAKKLVLDAKNLQTSEDDNVLVQGVEGSKYAIGYFGYAYFQDNAAGLKAIAVESVEPSFESAESGDYKLSRPLFIYSDAAILKEKPQVAAFINYYLTFVNDEIEAVGYFPASPEALDSAKQALLDALK